MNRRAALMAVAGLLGIGLLAVIRAAPQTPSQFHVSVMYGEYDVDDLLSAAEAVAILRPTGDRSEHWNNQANTMWAPTDVGTRAHIYRDETVDVVALLIGTLPAEQFTLRGVGGIVDGVTVEYDEQPELAAGRSYLAFLREEDTPTQEGFERRWTLLWNGHGLFIEGAEGTWANPLGIAIELDDLVAKGSQTIP